MTHPGSVFIFIEILKSVHLRLGEIYSIYAVDLTL